MDTALHVLDHGTVELLDYMGNDDAVVEAARVSYGASQQRRNNKDLLRYLMRHKHWSPFQMAELKFRIKAPIFVARQWMRHNGDINETSYRYTPVDEHDVYIPELSRIQTQSTANKQGSSEVSAHAPQVQQAMKNASELVMREYTAFIHDDIAREVARNITPVSTYTTWIWKTNLRDCLMFLAARLDEHAQWEIRQYAEAVAVFMQRHFPSTYEAFRDYVLDAVTLTALDVEVLTDLIRSYQEILYSTNTAQNPPLEYRYHNLHSRWTKGDIRESKERLKGFGL